MVCCTSTRILDDWNHDEQCIVTAIAMTLAAVSATSKKASNADLEVSQPATRRDWNSLLESFSSMSRNLD